MSQYHRLPWTLSALLLCTCTKAPPPGPSPVDTLVQGITEQQILVDVTAFSKGTQELSENAKDFCSEPSEEGLSAMRKSWRKIAKRWYRVQLFNFGPADADPVLPLYSFMDSLRVRGTDYTSSVSTTLEIWRTSDDDLNSAFFHEQRFNDLGILATEVALYENEDLLQVLIYEPRECKILRGVIDELKRRASELSAGWTEDYAGTGTPFSQLLMDGKLPNGRYPLVQLLVSAQEYVDYLHRRNVATIAGQVSGISWDLMTSAVDAIEQLLAGELDGGNIFFYMADLGSPDSVEKVKTDLAAVRAALESEDVDEFEAALALLDGDFKREIPAALGVDLGLTLTDGD